MVVGFVGSGGVTGSVPLGFGDGTVGGVPGRLGSEGARFGTGVGLSVAPSGGERRSRSDVGEFAFEEPVLGVLRCFLEGRGGWVESPGEGALVEPFPPGDGSEEGWPGNVEGVEGACPDAVPPGVWASTVFHGGTHQKMPAQTRLATKVCFISVSSDE